MEDVKSSSWIVIFPGEGGLAQLVSGGQLDSSDGALLLVIFGWLNLKFDKMSGLGW